MAIQVAQGGGGSRFGRRRYGVSVGTLSEINIIPLVDVVLVLLIIFMLTAHVMEYGLEIDVPKVVVTRDSPQELPVVTVTRKAEIRLNDEKINIHQLGPEIKRRFPKADAVYVKADKATQYDPIAQVIAELSDAKFSVKLVTKADDSAGR
jgi:biopolymer transport protein ExbD